MRATATSETPCPRCGEQLTSSAFDEDRCPSCHRSLVVCGRYSIEGLLGKGGMATVYAGRRKPDGHEVAIKIQHLEGDEAWKAYELFERSTVVLQDLSHEALPTIHAFEQDQDGRLVLVRDRYEGGTLFERVRAHGPLGGAQAVGLLERLLDLFEYLQSRVPPVIHRDVKPQNIMFRSPDSDEPVLVDFDTVALPSSDGMTVVGTPGYAAPEQLTGDACPASDLYSLGATMLFTLTGREPDDLPRRGGRIDMDEALAGVTVERGVKRIVQRLLEPSLDRRYASASQVRRALDRASSEALTRREAIATDPRLSASRRLGAFDWLLTGLAMAAIGGFIVWGVMVDDDEFYLSLLVTVVGSAVAMGLVIFVPISLVHRWYAKPAHVRRLVFEGGELTITDGADRELFAAPLDTLEVKMVLGSNGIRALVKPKEYHQYVVIQGSGFGPLVLGRESPDHEPPEGLVEQPTPWRWPDLVLDDSSWRTSKTRLGLDDELDE